MCSVECHSGTEKQLIERLAFLECAPEEAIVPRILADDETQSLFFDDAFTDQVFTAAPYAAKGTRNTRNNNDGIYQEQLLVPASKSGNGYAAAFNIGIQMS